MLLLSAAAIAAAAVTASLTGSIHLRRPSVADQCPWLLFLLGVKLARSTQRRRELLE